MDDHPVAEAPLRAVVASVEAAVAAEAAAEVAEAEVPSRTGPQLRLLVRIINFFMFIEFRTKTIELVHFSRGWFLHAQRRGRDGVPSHQRDGSLLQRWYLHGKQSQDRKGRGGFRPYHQDLLHDQG